MAKRKRLTPAQPTYLSGSDKSPAAAPGPLSMGAAPIAQVASDTSASAALEELSSVLEQARTKGLMIEELPLSAIDETYLVRDRIEQGEDDMLGLMESLRARGQHTPIEVVKREDAHGEKTHGLISGWRRLTALNRLYQETSDPKFATVKALVVRPESAADAYVAMVEENEIRVNLSHYERARIAVQALAEGVYPDQRKALLGLFQNVPRAKRSKIASFVTLVEALDDVLRYPTAIPEKLGLAIARHLEENPRFGRELAGNLIASDCQHVSEELAVLHGHIAAWDARLNEDLDSDPLPSPAPAPAQSASASSFEASPLSRPSRPAQSRVSLEAAPGVTLTFTEETRKIELRGDGVTPDLMQALQDWLAQR
ncbi:ParB/RepB/Spo0J family partition protein [Tritonibacter mobilis]|uniref:ParB/RepB/Spo0J family partition protein n=1 Tax=Tritonibacter mobilis TaxID=379347 RepID=UPI001C093552|nr:ParB N-terminal domain-containing protein [Tritonibacter mobilis]MBU3035990.1 ParB N-terminal domain-containing protein [Tritonibacter mobilis]WHQ85292.1 ParB N-terminal domain-containing protein [Tritonibacter mobilis]